MTVREDWKQNCHNHNPQPKIFSFNRLLTSMLADKLLIPLKIKIPHRQTPLLPPPLTLLVKSINKDSFGQVEITCMV